jgi:hypothetical protein
MEQPIRLKFKMTASRAAQIRAWWPWLRRDKEAQLANLRRIILNDLCESNDKLERIIEGLYECRFEGVRIFSHEGIIAFYANDFLPVFLNHAAVTILDRIEKENRICEGDTYEVGMYLQEFCTFRLHLRWQREE